MNDYRDVIFGLVVGIFIGIVFGLLIFTSAMPSPRAIKVQTILDCEAGLYEVQELPNGYTLITGPDNYEKIFRFEVTPEKETLRFYERAAQ